MVVLVGGGPLDFVVSLVFYPKDNLIFHFIETAYRVMFIVDIRRS